MMKAIMIDPSRMADTIVSDGAVVASQFYGGTKLLRPHNDRCGFVHYLGDHRSASQLAWQASNFIDFIVAATDNGNRHVVIVDLRRSGFVSCCVLNYQRVITRFDNIVKPND